MPVILPPATIDAALAAQAAQVKRAVAEARGEALPPPAIRAEDGQVRLDDQDPTGESAFDEPLPLDEDDIGDIDDHFDDDPDDFSPRPPGDRAEPPISLAAAVLNRPPASPALGVRAVELPDDATAASEPGPERAVAEAAASGLAAMRSVKEAHERHLEAIELEAARRCELLAAQAELDAELIRLHARREAHAIVSAARTRSDEAVSPVVADQLRDIGETFSRFAETVERSISSAPVATDTVWD